MLFSLPKAKIDRHHLIFDCAFMARLPMERFWPGLQVERSWARSGHLCKHPCVHGPCRTHAYMGQVGHLCVHGQVGAKTTFVRMTHYGYMNALRGFCAHGGILGAGRALRTLHLTHIAHHGGRLVSELPLVTELPLVDGLPLVNDCHWQVHYHP